MINYYKYLFYRVYSNRNAAHGKSELPVLTSLLLLSILFYVNVLSFFILLGLFTGINFFQSIATNKLYIIGIAAFIPLLHYVVLYRDKRSFENFVHKMQKTGEQKKKPAMMVYVYPLASIVILIISLVLLVGDE